MKATVSRKELKGALALSKRIIEKRNSMPILANVLIDARDGDLRLIATDLEVASIQTLRAAVAEPGSTTVPVKALAELIGKLKAEMVEIEAGDDARMMIRVPGASSSFSIAGTAAEEYPTLPEVPLTTWTRISQDDMAELLSVDYAASRDEQRWNLNGVNLVNHAGQIEAQATDGHRLAIASVPGSVPLPEGKESSILPLKLVLAMSAVKAKGEEWRIAFEGDRALVRLGETTLIGKLIDGKYANVHQVFNPKAEGIRVDCAALEAALEAVKPFTPERSSVVKLTAVNAHLEIEASNPDLGKALESIPADSAFPASWGMNVRYLLDMLSGLDGDTVLMQPGNPEKPAEMAFRFDCEEKPNRMAVIMPMRL